ncbi:hypothetical protein [Nonomuraea gerenzanensis]|uniref:hypothetical protein n=1 Tax=Nonomuraea gerenzanensis TaxID=93944 RepID=UPI001CD9EB60|nr:hypothetical protein [Nonomuraea gerenzanensis]UBU11358.1 hypothetical protein LCN96_44750 [Nonomuraea gerenzanensis]
MSLGLAVPFTDPAALMAWARHADAGPHDRIGVPDRVGHEVMPSCWPDGLAQLDRLADLLS